ncbi:CopG family transcriptional regulator [Gammaproteobacteria bacterium]
MGKTNAERQAAFRARRKTELDADGFADARLETWVPVRTKFALTRLAAHKGVTEREVLVELLTREETRIRKGMSLAENRAYMDAFRR